MPEQMPGCLVVWVEPPSSDRSGGTVAKCCPGSKAGAEEECRGGKIEGEKLEPKLMPFFFFFFYIMRSLFLGTRSFMQR